MAYKLRRRLLLNKIINETPYIKVSPEECQWLIYGDTLFYDVKSNTKWNIDNKEESNTLI